MFPSLLISAVLLNFVVADNWNYTRHDEEQKQTGVENINKMVFNKTSYFDKAENMLLYPKMTKVEENKKKIYKKSPKRTIQKIIKKNRQKTKKIYVVLMTSSTTSPEVNEQGQDDRSDWKEVVTTQLPNQKKRAKKYNTKYARYPKPFQKLQKKKFYKRTKRNIFDNDDVFYLIKDFDEAKFLDGEY